MTPRQYIEKYLPDFGGEDEEKCWNWTGTIATNGYGRANYQNRRISAHRFVYELLIGEVPLGKELCHHCDNRRCCNPLHLFIGTRSENMLDASKKGRLHAQLSPSTMPRGEQHGRAKLTVKQVKEIREIYENREDWQPTQLGRKYGVSRSAIFRAATKENWSVLRALAAKDGR